MKDLVTPKYIFSPGTSTNGYVEFLDLNDFSIERLVCIINQTRGVVVYATGAADKKYSSVSGNRVYLFFDTSTYSSSDKLQIIYNSSSPLATNDNDTYEIIKLLSRLVKIAENQQATDSAQRQRVNVDAALPAGANTIGAVNIAASQTLATVTTVSTVSTVTSMTNAAAIAGMDREMYINVARNTYANSIRSKIV